MDQNLGKSPPSGNSLKSALKKKAKPKRGNGKGNGKTNWKGLCQELSKAKDTLEQEKSELEIQVQELEEDLEDKDRIISSLKTELVQRRQTSMGEREKVVLRNLKHFHGRMVNAQLKCDEDKAHITKACEEVSRFIKEQI
jgi:predicted RNase H-like nuclease (RuvC/YqgF family)